MGSAGSGSSAVVIWSRARRRLWIGRHHVLDAVGVLGRAAEQDGVDQRDADDAAQRAAQIVEAARIAHPLEGRKPSAKRVTGTMQRPSAKPRTTCGQNSSS